MKLLLLFLAFGLISASAAESSEQPDSLENDKSNTTDEAQDLYVIRTVVYEVGILTNASDSEPASNETHEQVDVTFFDPHHNGSLLDLSNIPLPVQTNVSGVQVTGILPANFGNILLQNGTAQINGSFPILPNKQIRITQNISTDNPGKESAIISNLPAVLGLDKIIKSEKPSKEN